SDMGNEYGALLGIAAGRLLALLDDGQAVLLAVSPAEFTEQGRFQALGKCFAQPAVANGKLYVRDHEQLVCFDLKNTAGPADKAGVRIAAQGSSAPGKLAATKGRRPVGTGLFPLWEDKRNTYFVGWLAGLVLALLGVLVVKRKQILSGAAVTQSATLAAAVAMWLDGVLPAASKQAFSSKTALALALGFAVAAAFLVGLGRARGAARAATRGASGTPWTVLVAASVGVGFISQLQLATIDLHHVLASTIISDTKSEVARLAGLALFTVIFVAVLYGLALRSGAAKASASGFTLSLTTVLLAGVIIGVSVRATGTLFTFAFLVFPALAAGRLGRGWLCSFGVGAALALAAVTCGFTAALHYHQAPAQAAAAIVCAAWPVCALWSAAPWRRSRPRGERAGVSEANAG
ncbi:MAG: metal ABC transporter permease, partial [Planctomycetota bacterium]